MCVGVRSDENVAVTANDVMETRSMVDIHYGGSLRKREETKSSNLSYGIVGDSASGLGNSNHYAVSK